MSDGSLCRQQVLELSEGQVTEVRPLVTEEPFTEWLRGCISLRREDGVLRAYYKGKPLT